MTVKLSREATNEMVRLLYLWIDELEFSRPANDIETPVKTGAKPTDQNVSRTHESDEPTS